MTIPNWLYGYAATEAGSSLRAAVRSGEPVSDEDHTLEGLSYRRRWEALQEALSQGQLPETTGLRTVTRSLIDDAQADSTATGRVDLHDALTGLTSLPGGAGDFFHELLSPAPDRDRLRRLSAPFHGNVRFEADSMQSTATLHFEGGQAWPEAIGGRWTSERMRSITVNCRYAKWRDRRVRRLCRVQVTAQDIVPAT